MLLRDTGADSDALSGAVVRPNVAPSVWRYVSHCGRRMWAKLHRSWLQLRALRRNCGLPLQPIVRVAAACPNPAADPHGKGFRISRVLETLAQKTSDLDAPSLVSEAWR